MLFYTGIRFFKLPLRICNRSKIEFQIEIYYLFLFHSYYYTDCFSWAHEVRFRFRIDINTTLYYLSLLK